MWSIFIKVGKKWRMVAIRIGKHNANILADRYRERGYDAKVNAYYITI